MILARSSWSRCAWTFTAVPVPEYCSVRKVTSWRTFFLLVQGRGIVDPLAALLTGKDIDHQMRRAHQARLHGCGSLERQQCVHQGRVDPSAALGQDLGGHEMPLAAVQLNVRDAAGIYHGQIRPQAAADLFLRTAQLMLE
jgi:hypothetical protein